MCLSFLAWNVSPDELAAAEICMEQIERIEASLSCKKLALEKLRYNLAFKLSEINYVNK